ncbi:MAG: glycosyltransferase family 39 protein [Deltaproteobacteria bacterium]|nr:glycosyltransferase family 39 protein [Deltaproteobacteria bacterium]
MKRPEGTAGIASAQADAALPRSSASRLKANYVEGIADSAVRQRPGVLERLAPARIAIPLVCACGALLFIVNLGNYPFYTKGEPREAVTVFDIVHGGGIILPMRAGVEVPSKPLMMHWLAALVSLAAGQVNEWTVRLPSAVFAIFGLIVCYCYTRRFFDEHSALLAALILGTSCQYLQAGGARVDMILTIFLEVALYHFLAIAEGLSKRSAPLYLAIAGAVLTKGPIGAALPIMVAVIWITLAGRMELLRTVKLGQGALIVGAISGGWYLAAIISGGTAFVNKQLLAENLYRLFARRGFNEGHAHSYLYMEGALLAGFMPWSPVAALAALRCWKQPHKINARFGYLLVWFLTVLLFYNLPHSKRGVYLLPLYPALSAIIAVALSEAFELPLPALERWTGIVARFAGAFFIAAGVSALIGGAMLFYWPAPLRWMLARFGILVMELPLALRTAASEHWLAMVLIPLTAIAIGASMLVSRPSIERMAAGIAAGTMAITLAVNLIIQPAIANTLSPKEFAMQASERAGLRTIYYFGSLDYAFVFYSGRDVKFASLNAPPELIVGSEEQWPLMPSNFRAHYRMVLRSNPTELDGSGRLLLLRRTDASS